MLLGGRVSGSLAVRRARLHAELSTAAATGPGRKGTSRLLRLAGLVTGGGLAAAGGMWLYEQNLNERDKKGVVVDPHSLLGRTDQLLKPALLMGHSAVRWSRSMSTVVVVKTSEALLHQRFAAARWWQRCRDDDLEALQQRLRDEEMRRLRDQTTATAHDYRYELARRQAELRGLTRERLDAEEQGALKLLHYRNAHRVLQALLDNGGIYIKAGQLASTSMRGIIPDEYVDTLSVLQDRIPSIDYAQVERIVLEEFGQPIDALFEEFSREPIAAASLGQVHRARLRRDGSLVAVKVQYPLVEKYLPGDLFTIKQILKIYWYEMPPKQRDSNLAQLDSVKHELDFQLETQNMLRTKRQLANFADLYVPSPVLDMVTKRLLVMEFIDDAVRVSDRDGLRRLGVDPAFVAELLTRAFCEQIFVHGFVHCDPHPGNILVRRNPEQPRRGQVVLLDHGLYTQLSDEFRQSYLQLWYAIITDDDDAVASFCSRFGMDHPHIFKQALMFQFLLDKVDVSVGTNAAGDEIVGPSQEQFNNVKDMLSKMSFVEFNNWRKTMENFPPELRLVMRNQMLLLGVNQLLGSKINRFAIQADVVRRLVKGDDSSQLDKSLLNDVYFHIKVGLFSAVQSLIGWISSFFTG